MDANLSVLRSGVDASGTALEVIEVPQMSYFDIDGETYRNSYLNFYIANGGIVVPTADHPNDADALAIIAAAFPDREVVGVTSRVSGVRRRWHPLHHAATAVGLTTRRCHRRRSASAPMRDARSDFASRRSASAVSRNIAETPIQRSGSGSQRGDR